ncbi:proprotein convertase P-domain-containing protein [Myxococcus qinghaiensis]|uniref:proprotein convertase P-domain-containing protein n=1 Tax=Myxococcus qinghaiensis TaxID=2906758 RepID=UPI0020A6FCC3|nr:proprotein convertase P-domain-containing protein [Myxococcus qinghaiensis]MCP3162102.1 proprotein convertase P-domain-containing protein [Myxococcus qinghaiensis]
MTSNLMRYLPLSVLPLMLSCGVASEETAPAAVMTTQAQALATGTPASTGVLAFLNSRSTTLAVLDFEVPLNALTAQAIIADRNGPDGIEFTADDRHYVSIDQVDAIPQVGPAALATLEGYVRATGRVEMPLDEQVGVFHGVAFNLAEARRVVAAANTVSQAALQSTVGLSANQAQAIVAARRIDHIVELSRLAFMNGAALQALKNHVALAPDGDPCTGPATCQAGLSCEGRAFGGPIAYGRCRSNLPIPGDSDSCSVMRPCQTGLVCSGSESGSPEGICRPAWMAGTFTNYSDLALPGSTVQLVSVVGVVGLATVPEDITVVLDLLHSSSSNLVLTLEDPGGETALLWNGPTEGRPPSRIPVTRGIPRDGTINGKWKLHISNPAGVGSGTLREWSVKLTSRWD